MRYGLTACLIACLCVAAKPQPKEYHSIEEILATIPKGTVPKSSTWTTLELDAANKALHDNVEYHNATLKFPAAKVEPVKGGDHDGQIMVNYSHAYGDAGMVITYYFDGTDANRSTLTKLQPDQTVKIKGVVTKCFLGQYHWINVTAVKAELAK